MVNQDQQLDELFAKYREACPEVDANPNFMPQVWARIDARRQSEQWFFRWANSFAGAAALLALVLGVLIYQHPNPLPQRAYIEKLTDEISEDHFLDAAYVARAQTPSKGGSR